MLRLANYYFNNLFGDTIKIENLSSFDRAIEDVGPENVVQVFTPSGGVTFNRILYEDDTLPRSTCPGCHGFIRPEDKFCIHCGASLQEMVCHHCRHTERPGAKFCSQCGAPLVVLKVKSIDP